MKFDIHSFRCQRRIAGSVAFLTALIVYVITAEPTVSFWDAGEFISTSSKLQIGHPPGAPLYQMFGAVISGLAPSQHQVALFINFLSGLTSALAVLILFHTIIDLLTYDKDETYEPGTPERIALIGAGLVGALALAFSDTFWFSAVEAEVYGPATFLSALLFWLGIKWVKQMNKPRGNKWLVLIAFVIGLSFGVHFLAILTIPAIGMLYFYEKYPHPEKKQFIIANIAVVLILVIIFKVLMPYTLKYFSALEIFFTNSVGLPFHWGTLIAGLLLAYLFYYLLKKSNREKRSTLETVTLMFLYLLIGFSSWIMLPVRSNANPPINENAPRNARELLAYYNREQYGETYLFYGPYYTAYYHGLDPEHPYRDDKPKYEQDTVHEKYVIVNNYKLAKQNLNDKYKGLLPRMWDPGSASNYEQIMGYRPGFKGKPSLLDNLIFFWKYQLGYMYWRYFLWNFVGRQDDVQGHLDNHGNWLSGITPIDEIFVGPQKNLPSNYLHNPSRHTYFFLPLLLGILGMLFHFKKDPKRFYATLMLFIFTGIAVLFYTNVKPFEPRERDYAVVVSFYTFAIWIGIGVYALYIYLSKKLKPSLSALLSVLLSFLAVPVLLAQQNWFDHDRSHKYSAYYNALAYLNSVQKNGILYTIGDNDTFPLWFAQEVEGDRRDIKIINESLFNTDWYIDEMKYKTYDAEGAPIKMPHKKYVYGTREVLMYQPLIKDTLDIKDFMKLVLSDRQITQNGLGSYFINPDNNQKIYIYPTRYIRIPVNKENVLKYGIVPAKDSAKIVKEIIIDTKGQDIYKAQLAMLDILANNDWKRPIYFSGGSFKDSDYTWLKDYLQLDGLSYKLVPIKTKSQGSAMGRIDTDTMYRNVKKFKWTLDVKKNMYLDPETRRNSLIYRMNLFRLAHALHDEGKDKKAEEILDLVFEKMPLDKFGYYYSVWDGLDLYYKLDKKEKARKIARQLIQHYKEYLLYYNAMDESDLIKYGDELGDKLMKLQTTLRIISSNDPEYYKEINKDLKQHITGLANRLGYDK